MTLTIVVCVTSVVDIEAPLEIERGALTVEEASLPHVLNPADANAIEAALILRDARPESRVIAVSAGPASQDAALREAIAQGVNEVVRLPADLVGCLETARLLSAAVRKAAAGIAVCGELSVDGNGGLTGAMLAELMGWPLIDRVSSCAFADNEGYLRTERRRGGGSRIVERTPFPAVMTVATGANVPRYPTLRSRLQSRSAPIPGWDAAQLGLDSSNLEETVTGLRTTALRRPPPDPRGLIDPGSDLPPEERWQMAVSGGVQERESALIEGSPEELAERIMRVLRQGSVIRD
jgi:electron transfer flavoprotein alpha/beta subunit